MEIDKDTIKDILFFLDNQKQMYEMTINHESANIIQKKAIKMLLNRIDKLINKLNL